MYPKPIQTLIELFSKLPGVGPRQAARMAFFVLREPASYVTALASTLKTLKTDVDTCRECFRATEGGGQGGPGLAEVSQGGLCDFCVNPSRDHGQICIVEKEMDILTFEKSGLYTGIYHVLGGTFSALDPDSLRRLRLKELYGRVARNAGERSLEIIIATGQTSEGDTTALYVERMLDPLKQAHPGLVISRLGRGLSAGAELEYADEVTLRHALENRKLVL